MKKNYFIGLSLLIACLSQAALLLPKRPSSAPVKTKKIIKDVKKIVSSKKSWNIQETLHENDDLPIPSLEKKIFFPNSSSGAGVLAIDNDFYELGDPRPIRNATVYWAGIQSKVTTTTNSIGFASSPYKRPLSSRFVIHAKGYLPAVGYLVAGKITPVIMYRAYLLKTLINVLNFEYDSSLSMLLGKILNSDHQSFQNVEVNSSADVNKQSYYSTGSLGLFMASVSKTGNHGDFFIPGIDPWDTNYILPNLVMDNGRKEDLPAMIVDMSNIPKASSVTIENGDTSILETQLLDAYARIPLSNTGQVVVSGQRDLYTTDKEGYVSLSVQNNRGSIDIVEALAPGYLNTWVSSPADSKVFPPQVFLFTKEQIRNIMGEWLDDYNLKKGIVFGSLNKEHYTTSTNIRLINSKGRTVKANLKFFDEQNEIDPLQESTDPNSQNFVISNLDDGEWHIILSNEESEILSSAVVRTEAGIVSQVYFY